MVFVSKRKADEHSPVILYVQWWRDFVACPAKRIFQPCNAGRSLNGGEGQRPATLLWSITGLAGPGKQPLFPGWAGMIVLAAYQHLLRERPSRPAGGSPVHGANFGLAAKF